MNELFSVVQNLQKKFALISQMSKQNEQLFTLADFFIDFVCIVYVHKPPTKVFWLIKSCDIISLCLCVICE